MEGFVLNRKAGGTSNGWNHRSTYCRVYHPMNFEFEISIENLLYVLENTSSIKGKGLENKMILGWQGKDLILIPEDAPEYQDMIKFTDIQKLKVSKKELIPGNIYINGYNDKVVFLKEDIGYDWSNVPKGLKLFFYHIRMKEVIKFNIGSIKVNTNEKVNSEDFNLYCDQFMKNRPKKVIKEEYEKVGFTELSKNYAYRYVKYFIKETIKKKEVYTRIGFDWSSQSTYDMYYYKSSKEHGAAIVKGLSMLDITKQYPVYKVIQKDYSPYQFVDPYPFNVYEDFNYQNEHIFRTDLSIPVAVNIVERKDYDNGLYKVIGYSTNADENRSILYKTVEEVVNKFKIKRRIL